MSLSDRTMSLYWPYGRLNGFTGGGRRAGVLTGMAFLSVKIGALNSRRGFWNGLKG
jgi:hypothetical protein